MTDEAWLETRTEWVGCGVILLLTLPTVVDLLNVWRSSRDIDGNCFVSQRPYEDEDGTATTESEKKFWSLEQNILITSGAVSGLAIAAYREISNGRSLVRHAIGNGVGAWVGL
jgi:hypothetical protein